MSILNKMQANKYWLLLFGAAVVLYHLFTLAVSPLPWFDETFFASVTHSLMNGKGFELEVAPMLSNGKPILTYGPLYFLLSSVTTYVFGFGPFGFRLLNLAAAAGCVWLVKRYTPPEKNPSVVSSLLIFLLVFDTMFLQNAHSGRMDMIAVFFLLAAFRPYFLGKDSTTAYVLSALLLTAGLLTTPRIVIYALPLAAIVLYRGVKFKQVGPVLIYGGVVLAGILTWIFWGFGGIAGFIEYYSGAGNGGGEESLIKRFLGGNFLIPRYQYPLIFLTLAMMAYGLFSGKKLSLQGRASFSIILIFYLVVKDVGIYSALIMPLWYLLFFEVWDTSTLRPGIKTGVVVLLACVNIGIFSVKALTVLSDYTARSPRAINNWVSKHVPPGARIVGTECYYYAAIHNGNAFQYIDHGGKLADRVSFHLNEFKTDYIMVSSMVEPEVLKAYTGDARVRKVADIKNIVPQSIFSRFVFNIISRLGISISSSYNGVLYKVENNEQTR